MGSNDRYDPLSDQVVESVSISWEEMKGYNGAFKLTQPGQYAYQQSLCRQPFTGLSFRRYDLLGRWMGRGRLSQRIGCRHGNHQKAGRKSEHS